MHGCIVYVHGYLDSAAAWSQVIDCMAELDVRQVVVDLDEQDKKVSDSTSLLDSFANQVIAICDELPEGEDIVLVGHSMGGAIVELAAAHLGTRIKGVVLITPAPLKGVRLPQDVMNKFKSRLGSQDIEAIKNGRLAMSRSLSETGLSILVNSSLQTGKLKAMQQLLAWTGGHPKGAAQSVIRCPVLVVATDDTFFTVELLETESARFDCSRLIVLKGAGHWAHLEKPGEVAEHIWRFTELVLK